MIKTCNLRRLYKAACRDKKPQRFFEDLEQALTQREIRPADFSIRQLFEEFLLDERGEPCGREIVSGWRPGAAQDGEAVSFSRLVESGTVDTAAFSTISGQLFYNAILDGYAAEEFVFSKLIPTVQTQFNGEQIAGIDEMGDKAEVVAESQPYPVVGTSEDWIETPQTLKRGLIVGVTREAIFFDRTGLLIERARKVGEALGLNREKRAIDCIIDENGTAHRYNRKGRGLAATYGASSGVHDWDNLQTANALVDWTDVDTAEQKLGGQVDPNTGEPLLMIHRPQLICVKGLERTALRIRNATEVTTVAPGFATSGQPVETKSFNPVGGTFDVVSNRLLATRLATDSDWFYGDPVGAFRYMQNWPLQVVQALSNSELEFTQDVVMRWKASERGTYATVEPRRMVKCTAS